MRRKTRHAVILAAGRGSRLGAAARGEPKCLLEVCGMTLIERQVAMLRDVGVERTTVVVGYGAGHVRARLKESCDYVHNERYAETNSLYSLWLARERIRGSLVLMNGDVLMHPDVLGRVLGASGSALAYDSSSGHDAEHMKVCVEGGLVRAMGKDLDHERAHGENVGVLYFDGDATAALFSAAGAEVAAGHIRAWAPAAVDQIARRVAVRAVDVAGVPWCEVDFPDDLRHARDHVWPAIDRPSDAFAA